MPWEGDIETDSSNTKQSKLFYNISFPDHTLKVWEWGQIYLYTVPPLPWPRISKYCKSWGAICMWRRNQTQDVNYQPSSRGPRPAQCFLPVPLRGVWWESVHLFFWSSHFCYQDHPYTRERKTQSSMLLLLPEDSNAGGLSIIIQLSVWMLCCVTQCNILDQPEWLSPVLLGEEL